MNSPCFGLLQSLPNQCISCVYHRIDLCSVKHQPHLKTLKNLHLWITLRVKVKSRCLVFMTLHPRFHINDATACQVGWKAVEELGASEHFFDSIHSVHLFCIYIKVSFYHCLSILFFNLFVQFAHGFWLFFQAKSTCFDALLHGGDTCPSPWPETLKSSIHRSEWGGAYSNQRRELMRLVRSFRVVRFSIFWFRQNPDSLWLCEYNLGYVAIEMRLGKIVNDERNLFYYDSLCVTTLISDFLSIRCMSAIESVLWPRNVRKFPMSTKLLLSSISRRCFPTFDFYI